MMNDKEKKAWEMTLALWKDLGTTDYSDIFPKGTTDHNLKFELIWEFKNNILVKLGYPKSLHGCPFCQYFYMKKDCPLGSCYMSAACVQGYSYKKWVVDLLKCGKPNKQYALQFYNELIKMSHMRWV